MKKVAATAAVATVGVVGFGTAAGAHSPRTHVVQPGETLSRIAGSNWRAVAEANNLANPNLIYPGQVLTLDGSAPSGGSSRPAAAPARTQAPAPAPAPAADQSSGGGTVWDSLAQCESGGNWSINTGNGYYGGLQFSAATWRSVGGPGLPHEHSREVQIKYAKILQARSGWGQWGCAHARND